MGNLFLVLTCNLTSCKASSNFMLSLFFFEIIITWFLLTFPEAMSLVIFEIGSTTSFTGVRKLEFYTVASVWKYFGVSFKGLQYLSVMFY